MASTDLQRLFYRTANSLVSPLEDFLSEVIRVAILHDSRPLLRLLEEQPEERWCTSSGRPTFDLDTDGITRVLEVDTQYLLDRSDDCEAGRLDVRVVLGSQSDVQEVWIEAKVDAPLTRRKDGRTQLDVYLDHCAVSPIPQPVLVTLAKEQSLDSRVTGFTWRQLAETVDAEGDADRWWQDLVAFLRADGIAPSPIPDEPNDPPAFMSVFKAANQCLKELSVGAPMSLRWPAIEKAVIGGASWFTAGPITWGMDFADGQWTWLVSIANHGYPSVTVPLDEVLAAARRAGIASRGWTRIDRQQRKRVYLFEKRRPFVGGDPDLEIGAWFCQAFHDLMETGMFEPHFRRVRETQARKAAAVQSIVPPQG